MIRATAATLNALCNSLGLKEQFTSAKLFLFSGSEPDTADEALDMATDHTQCAVITVGDSGTGVTFGTPANGILPKNSSESWAGTYTFDGTDDAESELVATFFRLCQGSDDGRGTANGSTGYRIQGSIGESGEGRDMTLGSSTVTAGDTQTIADFTIQIFGG